MARITKLVCSEDDSFHDMLFIDVYDDRVPKHPHTRISGYGDTVRLWSKEMDGPLRINFKTTTPEQMFEEMTTFIEDECNPELIAEGEESIDSKALDQQKTLDFFAKLLKEKKKEGCSIDY